MQEQQLRQVGSAEIKWDYIRPEGEQRGLPVAERQDRAKGEQRW
jgi:hypothetical protein